MQAKGMIMAGGSGAVGALVALAIGVATPEIVNFEGSESKAYKDIVGVLTVCSGYTGKDIITSKIYSKDECDRLTSQEAQVAAKEVLRTSPHLAWHPMQLAAAISFTYNVGGGAYAKSTVARLFNEGKYWEGCEFLSRYKYAGGKVVKGLILRRDREQTICFSTLTKEGMKYVQ